MRGNHERPSHLFSYLSPEQPVPPIILYVRFAP